MKPDLSQKRKAFCQEYLIDLNGTQAAIRAGYSEHTAQEQSARLLSNIDVSTHIQALMNERSKRTQISADYVLETIVSTIERCKQADPVVDRKGNPVLTENLDGEYVPAYTFNAMGVLKGAELLGKHLKMFSERVDHTSSDGTMSPRGLEEIYADLRPAP